MLDLTISTSFTFSNNLWYHLDQSNWTGPNLPKQRQMAFDNKTLICLVSTIKTIICKPIHQLLQNYYPGIILDYEGKNIKNPIGI